MMKNLFKLSAVLLLMISGCSNEGERNSSSSAVATPEPQVNVVQVRARNIDLNTKKIEREDTWYSVWNVIDAIKRDLPLKDAYESNSEYKKRISDFKNKNLFDDVSLSKNLILELSYQVVEYDPESRVLKYRTFLDSTGTLAKKYHALKIGDRAGPNDSKTLSMLQIWRERLGVDVSNRTFAYVEDEKLLPALSNVIVKYKAEPDLARKIIKRLKVYVVGEVKHPYYFRDDYFPHDQSDVMADVHVLPFSVKGVWLVDKETGEVLSKSYKLSKSWN